MKDYEFGIERLGDVWDEFEFLFRDHYAEMADRLKAEGHEVSPFNPNKAAYISFNEAGTLIFFTVRDNGEPVGHSTVYVTEDMHNGDMIAREDTIYIDKAHRNGVGAALTRKIVAALKTAGVKRLAIDAATDPRAAKLWRRMGFKETAVLMTQHF